MFETIQNNGIEVMRDIIRERRSVRSFDARISSDAVITEVIQAGIRAPYASLPAAGTDDFRRFIVMKRNSEAFYTIADQIDISIRAFATTVDPDEKGDRYSQMIHQAAAAGFARIIGNCPCLIFVAERKGRPDNAAHSLGYCIQSMWLQATSLRIGVRLFDIVSQIDMNRNEIFKRNLHLENGDHFINCMGIGFPAEDFMPAMITVPDFEKSVLFL